VKNGIRLVIMSASFGLIAGCAVATAPGYVGPAEQPTSLTLTRQQYRGFSVKPPTSLGWTVRVTEQSPLQATYRRSLPTKTHTFVAAVSLIQLDKNLAIEEALVPHGLSDSERVRSLENSHQPDTSRKATCIRYSIHYQDLKAANSPDAALELIDRGFVCAHPTMPGLAVRASFSERGLPGELDPGLWSEFEDFLRNIHIESAPGVPTA
jgi:hypothetical protein